MARQGGKAASHVGDDRGIPRFLWGPITGLTQLKTGTITTHLVIRNHSLSVPSLVRSNLAHGRSCFAEPGFVFTLFFWASFWREH